MPNWEKKLSSIFLRLRVGNLYLFWRPTYILQDDHSRKYHEYFVEKTICNDIHLCSKNRHIILTGAIIEAAAEVVYVSVVFFN